MSVIRTFFAILLYILPAIHGAQQYLYNNEANSGLRNRVYSRRANSTLTYRADNVENFTPYQGDRHDYFEWILSTTLSKYTRGTNMVISPLSVKLVLAMLREGAAGSTEKELRTMLQFPEDIEEMRTRFASIIDSLQIPNSDYILKLGSRVYLDNSFTALQKYSAVLTSAYKTKVEMIEFKDVRSKDIINEWVRNATQGKISHMVSEDDLHDAVMLLLNAVYFKGIWSQEFPLIRTHVDFFNVNPTQAVNSYFISNTGQYYFCDSARLNSKIVRLPYKGGRFAMYVILPKNVNGLTQLLNEITSENFHEQVKMMDNLVVEVTLPKFTFEFTARLRTLLEQLGIHNIFQNSVSLPGIDRGKGLPKQLIVSDVIQKSGIEVNEQGTEAFAATDVQIGTKFGTPEHTFNATHPFLFLIEDELNGTILFFGKIENPQGIRLPINNPGSNINNVNIGQSGIQNQNTQLPNPPNFPQYPGEAVSNNIPGSINVPARTDANDRFNSFDQDLVQKLLEDHPTGNVLVSPASVKATLGMILEGAGEKTAQELQFALKLPADPKSRQAFISKYLQSLKRATNNVHIESSNKIFYADGLTPNQNYRATLQRNYFTDIQPMNFRDPSSVDIINNWVAAETKGLITRLVVPGSVPADTKMMILNAVYFKGLWEKTFPTTDTFVRCFYPKVNICQESYIMELMDNFSYADIATLDSSAIKIPFKDTKYAMLVLLPKKRDGVQQLVRNLQSTSINDILSQLKTTEILLALPRFKAEFTNNLVPTLTQIGIKDLFTTAANLSGMITNESRIQVNNILHKVAIDVDEQGSTAAASTGAMIIPLIGNSLPHFRVDHPFLFYIYDTEDVNILFGGRINEPTRAGKLESVKT